MKKGLILVVAAVLVIGGFLSWYLLEKERVAEPAEPTALETGRLLPTPAETDVQVKAAPAPEKAEVPEITLEEIPLPPLYQSDDYLVERLSGLVGEEAVERHFVTDAIAARTVATVDALGSDQVPSALAVMTGAEGDFLAIADSDPQYEILDEAGDPLQQYLYDPANAERYTAAVEMLESIGAARLVSEYRRNYPLLQQAWREQGYSEGEFEDRLKAVIDELLATPDVSEPYRLVKPEAVYLFADPELEKLGAGQKALLRMGSDNAARVKSVLSEFRKAI